MLRFMHTSIISATPSRALRCFVIITDADFPTIKLQVFAAFYDDSRGKYGTARRRRARSAFD